jgi:hypothetical protein
VVERYWVLIDGTMTSAAPVSRGAALSLALTAVDAAVSVDVTVAEARTLEVFAHWRRAGVGWNVTAIKGWLQ